MDKKNILTKIKELFNSQEEKFETQDYKTQDGRILRVMGGLDVGTEVKELDSEGESDIEDGNYVLEDGVVLMIHGGKITEVTEVEDKEEDMGDMKDEEEKKDEMGGDYKDKMEGEYNKEIDTKLVDGTEIRILTKGESVSVGDMVLVKVGEGYKEAPEGRHEVEGGLVVYTDAQGNINEIETKETEEEDESMNEEMSELFSSISKLVDEVKELRKELGEIKTENQELKSKFSKFSKEPSEEPTTHEIKFSGKMTKEDRLQFFRR